MAVFTPVSLSEAKAYLGAYDIGQITHFEGIEEGVSNTNFKVETTTGRFALTLFEPVTPEADLPYFMALTRHLDAKGYAAPGPILRRDGEVMGRLNGKACALIKWLKGRWPRDAGPLHAFNAGVALAQLHLLTMDFSLTRKNSMGREAWPLLIDRCRDKARFSVVALEMIETFDGFMKDLDQKWPEDLPQGTIHGDFFIDNILMDDEAKVTGVIDYYYACTDSFAYDLAISLNAWGFSPGGIHSKERFEAFLQGYQSLRPLNEAERETLPILGRASAMRFTLTRLFDLLHHDPSWLVKPKDPEAFYRRFLWW